MRLSTIKIITVMTVISVILCIPGQIQALGMSGTYHLGIPKAKAAKTFTDYKNTHVSRSPLLPPLRPDVNGDVKNFFAYNFSTGQYYTTQATLRKVGGHCYIYVENSQWNANVSYAQVETLANEFDSRIYPAVTGYFGNEWTPGIDNDSRITILLLDIQDGYLFTETFFTGYFSFLDEMPDIAAQQPPYKGRSNEREMFYMDTFPTIPATDQFHETLAHEFQHMVHWHQNPNEEEWLDEGMADLATFVAGYGVNVDHFSAFYSNPEKSLFPFDGSLEAYGVAFTFVKYLVDQYAGSSETEKRNFVRKLANSGDSGKNSVQVALNYAGYSDVSFNDVYKNFCTAIYLDYKGIPKFSFADLDIAIKPLFTHSGYPVRDRSWDLTPWSRQYILFEDGISDSHVVKFKGADTGKFSMRMILFNKDGSITVNDVNLNNSSDGFYDLYDLGNTYSKAVMQLTYLGDAGPFSYRYNVGYAGPQAGVYPNPIFPDDIIFTVKSFIPPQVWLKRSGGSDEKITMKYVEKGLYNGFYHVDYSGIYDVSIYGEDEEGLTGTVRKTFTIQKLNRYVLNMVAFNGIGSPVNLSMGLGSGAEGVLLVSDASPSVKSTVEQEGFEYITGVNLDFSGKGTLADSAITFLQDAPEDAGIVAVNSNGIQWLSSSKMPSGVAASLSSFSSHALVRDIAAPEVVSTQITNGELQIRITEKGSGVNTAKSVVRINGAAADYTINNDVISVRVGTKNIESLAVMLTDMSGNSVEKMLAINRQVAAGESVVWPNPAVTTSNISMDVAGSWQLKIYDASGRLFHATDFSGNRYTWNLTSNKGEQAENGTYFAIINDQNSNRREELKISVLR